jgi:hypothetical protein
VNTLRIGAITICALATLAGSFALKRNATSEIMHRQQPTTPDAVATLDAAVGTAMANDRRRMPPTGANPATEFLPQSDTTGLLQESLSIDDLLDIVDADTGDDFTPVDHGRFAALLKSDPELRRAAAD